MPPDFVKPLANVPLHAVVGRFYRAVIEEAADYALEDGPAFARAHRYNVQGRFGALYFGDRLEVCRATVQAQGFLTARSKAFALLEFEIHVDHILDLTRADAQRALGITPAQLLKSREDPFAYELPNAIASAAYQAGRAAGILVPDITATGSTLALFPARLLSKDVIRLKQRHPF